MLEAWLYYSHYTILYYTILYYTILYYTILYYTVLYSTVLFCTVLYSTVLYSTVLDCTVLFHTIPSYTIPYCPRLAYHIPSLYQALQDSGFGFSLSGGLVQPVQLDAVVEESEEGIKRLLHRISVESAQ